MTTPDPFITVAELKTHLNKASTADDAELAGFISAACMMIVDRVGHVSTTSVTSDVRVSRGIAVLPERPVIDVTEVVSMPGDVTVPSAADVAGTPGWTLRQGGTLAVTVWGVRHVRVSYTAGRDPLPGNVRLAALELAAHLWQQSQLNTASTARPSTFGSDELALRGVGFALPYRVRELLGLGKLPTSDVQVG